MSKRERLERATAKVLEEAPDLTSLTGRILGALQTYEPVKVPGMDPALHWLPPHISKSEWTALGNIVVSHEKAAGTQTTISGECWMSLRLDGSNFSKVVKALRRRGLLELGGYSHRFAECMQKCLHGLMDKFHAQVRIRMHLFREIAGGKHRKPVVFFFHLRSLTDCESHRLDTPKVMK